MGTQSFSPIALNLWTGAPAGWQIPLLAPCFLLGAVLLPSHSPTVDGDAPLTEKSLSAASECDEELIVQLFRLQTEMQVPIPKTLMLIKQRTRISELCSVGTVRHKHENLEIAD